MKYLLGLCLAVLAGVCQADEVVSICYGYNCTAEAQINYNKAQLRHLGWMLTLSTSPAMERALIGQAVGRLYGWAGEQSLIHNDRGGNRADDGAPGRMDCIDHSTSTTRLLQLMERYGWLRWHKVGPIARRTKLVVFYQHFTAVIEETGTESPGARYAVDSWFVNNGQPAVVIPLADWEEGEGPDVE